MIDRFSEDVDFAVISGDMSGNQVKMLLSKLMKEVTVGFTEDKSFADISKGSKYRKQAFSYDALVGLDVSVNPIPSRIIVEISAFANPFPYEKKGDRTICDYLSEEATLGGCRISISP